MVRARVLVVGALVALLPAVRGPALAKTPAPSPSPGSQSLVLATGFERGPVSPETEEGLRATRNPAVVIEWQDTVAYTGRGAYRFVGGPLGSGDADIGNTGSKQFPLGGLEVWTGGAFNFTSFPKVEPVWILATSPTDGASNGADDKPVVKIAVDGRLILDASNAVPGLEPATSSVVLQLGTWYYLTVHGRNGADQVQELYIYDGATHGLIEVVQSTWTVSGSYRNRVAKWGFGTPQDSTGLEYYLDDISHFTGPANPGPVRVLPKVATSATVNERFTSVGPAAPHDAVRDIPADHDASYVRNDTASTSAHKVTFALTDAALAPTGTVHAVQAVLVARNLGADRKSAAAVGVGIVDQGSVEHAARVTVPTEYRTRSVVYGLNPFTSQRWSVGDVDAIQGVIRDLDATTIELRVTQVLWEVVYTAALPGARTG